MQNRVIRIIAWLIIAPLAMVSSCKEEDRDQFPPTPDLLWKPILTGTFQDLNDIQIMNVNSGWIAGENRTLLSTFSGDPGWSRVPVTSPLENLTSVFFTDMDNGWIAGNLSETEPKGQIAYTTVGGGYPIQQHISNDPLNVLYFTDELNGWAAGKAGHIIRTLDGRSWQVAPSFTDREIFDLFFLDGNLGWVAAGNGQVFYTRNGGEDWIASETGIDTDILSIRFIDERNGWACGMNNTILKAIELPDGGFEWERISILPEPADMVWNDIFFVDPFEGWVVGDFGRVYHTLDGGQNWEEQDSNISENLNGIYMVSSTNGWVIGDNGILLSYNPG